ncbi:hypothetical protein [Streptomyces sp. NPDC050528]|uniref:hypothetical protein n=1 Tax=Streptomyces sp. NPDC050528 TaxID=3365623 RepID=UPI00379AE99C
MIIPRRPTEHWVRLVAVDTDDRLLLVKNQQAGSAPRWVLPGVRRQQGVTARSTADALVTDLTLPTTEPGPQRLCRRSASSVVAGELARTEELLFLVRLDVPGPPGDAARWYAPSDLAALDEPVLPPDLADLVAELLNGAPDPDRTDDVLPGRVTPLT